MRSFEGSANPLADLSATVESEDRSISATLRHGGDIELRIHPMAYRKYREETLDAVLGSLLTRVWAEYRRRYFALVSAELGTAIRENEHGGGTAERAFRREWQALAVHGASPSRQIQLRSDGLTAWQVRIAPGTLRDLRSEDFLKEFDEALRSLMDDYHHKLAFLKDRHFGLKLPKTTHGWR